MSRWKSLLVLLCLSVMALGCDDECFAGACIDDEQCAEICLEVCDGEVVESFCSLDGFCDCECEFECI